MPVGWSKDYRLQPIVLVGHFQHQIVLMAEHFLNNRLERTIVPDHFDFNIDTGFNVGRCLLANPLGALTDHPFAHVGALIWRQQGGHFIREVIDGQEGLYFATNALIEVNRTAQRWLIVLLGIDGNQDIIEFKHDGNSLLQS